MARLSEVAVPFIKELWHTYLNERSYEKIINTFIGKVSPDFIMIGMGADEIRKGIGEAQAALAVELQETKGTYFDLSDEWYDSQDISDVACVVYGGFSMKEQSAQKKHSLFADIDCRFSAVCALIDGECRLNHMHISVPNIFQTAGEFFPKFINDRANEILQEEIEKKTTELERLNEEFIEQEKLYRIAISTSDDLIIVMDLVNKKTDYDKSKIEHIYDIPVNSIAEEGFFKVAYTRLHPDDKSRFMQVFNFIDGNMYDQKWCNSIKEPINSEYRIKHSRFGYMWICNTIIPIRNNKGEVIKIVSHIKNINEHKRREQELHGIAIRDGLTNLFNKVYTEQAVAELLKEPDINGALFMIDIDNFKGVNDSVGHLFADDVLKMFANILSSVFREGDIVGRFGGDEFIAFMKYKDSLDPVVKRAEEIISRFDAYIESLGNVPFKTSCSIGISVFPQNARVFSELYKKADDAMYASKLSGKHRVSFFKENNSCG